MKYLIRFAREEHLCAILEAETECFPADPWGEASVKQMLSDESVGFVLWHSIDDPHKIAGYLVYSKYSEVELYKIAVTPKNRRQGLATDIMTHLLRIARGTDDKRIILEVRESNAPARALYEKFGFVTDGVRKNYYKNPTENGILMSLDLNERQ